MPFPVSLATGPIPITTVTTPPAVDPDDVSLVGKVFQAEGGNLIEIFGHCNANSGSLYLLRNFSDATGKTSQWYPVDLDANDVKKISVDTTKPTGNLAGFFSGSWLAGDAREGSGGTYVVLQIGTATFDHLYASSRRV